MTVFLKNRRWELLAHQEMANITAYCLKQGGLHLVLFGVYFKLSLNSVMIPLDTSVDESKQAY